MHAVRLLHARASNSNQGTNRLWSDNNKHRHYSTCNTFLPHAFFLYSHTHSVLDPPAPTPTAPPSQRSIVWWMPGSAAACAAPSVEAAWPVVTQHHPTSGAPPPQPAP